ncbi:baseplate tail tube cap [Escherichia phage vB_EcoM-E33]|nr:baseplate tail tube cap [Enterobacteria phage vB_EcoM_IME540]UKH49078.1 baseplate tail tube cap [Escherichia phage vB_EcoM-E33]
MKVKELDFDVASLFKGGSKTSAGQSKTPPIKTTVTAQYPAERASGNDTSTDMVLNDLYKNGLLFTAYNFSSRVSPDLRNDRSSQMTKKFSSAASKLTGNSGTYSAVKNLFGGNTKGVKFDSQALANILLPRSKSDVDSVSHKFNDVGESLITKGGGTATGILSNVASTAVFGALESVTNGVMADSGEQIYTTARSMYAGPDNRTKVFTWEMTPRNAQDLIQIIKIYEIFNYYSYGETGNSAFAGELKEKIDTWYRSTFKKEAIDKFDGKLLGESITSFLSNVIVVSNPTIWYIRNFGDSSSYDGREDIFGPCQIQSIRFDKTPDGHFNGLAIAPNLPSTFSLEVTFREIITLNRGSLYTEGF